MVHLPKGYRGKHIEEARLCHSGNLAEYIYTHIHTHERLPHTIIMIKNGKKITFTQKT